VHEEIRFRTGASALKSCRREVFVDFSHLARLLMLWTPTRTAGRHEPDGFRLLNANGLGALILLLLLPALSLAPPASAQTAIPLTCLTNAQQIRLLTSEEAQNHLPVRLHGVVTYYGALPNDLFVQDDTAGIYVLVNTNASNGLAAGQEIEIAGITEVGDYAPIVKASVVRIIGKQPLPTPHHVAINQLFTGLEDSQRVEVRGVVRSTITLVEHHFLNLAMDGQRLMVSVDNANQSNATEFLDNLIGCTVRVRGVCYSSYNMRGQIRMPWVAVSSPGDIVVESSFLNEPKDLSIANLARFNSSGYYGNRVKVSGVVTLQEGNGAVFIQNHGCGLLVLLAQPAKFVPGDLITVSGYTSPGEYVPILEDATTQLLGHGEPPAPISTDLKSLLSSPENFAYVLVRVEASLINLIDDPVRQTLMVQASNSAITAHIGSPKAGQACKTLKNGSQLALVGVFVAQSPLKWIPGFTPSRERSGPNSFYAPPESVQLLLRSYDDITVIRQPSWWTLARLLRVLGIMTLVLLGGLAWVVMLDRRVRRQTQIIREKVRREGVLGERDRIAREFHDTLEQELVAISIQLDAVKAQSYNSTPAASRHLELARSMSRRSLSEVRRSVWDLRSHLLENGSLDTALREISDPLFQDTGIEVFVAPSGTPRRLPALTEHNLLRIGQEALANALKHSQAKRIVIGVRYGAKQVQLSIRDDGTGIDTQGAGSVRGGHFGLLDMRERAEKIGGSFCISSKRGCGTEVLVTVVTAPSAPPAQNQSASRVNSPGPTNENGWEP
jgi:signal transduction histidine kinase